MPASYNTTADEKSSGVSTTSKSPLSTSVSRIGLFRTTNDNPDDAKDEGVEREFIFLECSVRICFTCCVEWTWTISVNSDAYRSRTVRWSKEAPDCELDGDSTRFGGLSKESFCLDFSVFFDELAREEREVSNDGDNVVALRNLEAIIASSFSWMFLPFECIFLDFPGEINDFFLPFEVDEFLDGRDGIIKLGVGGRRIIESLYALYSSCLISSRDSSTRCLS
mmetsp:Transcript_10645/g.25393  ORF Transcript_10645/g.25393 Transcript_10645/m.25393 type:complete len:223 (-) Transcript_10645:688-1356(-)